MSRKVEVDNLAGIWKNSSKVGPEGTKVVAAPAVPGRQGNMDNTIVMKALPDKYTVLTNLYHHRKLVMIETPYSTEDPAQTQRLSQYTKLCLQDSISRGEAPFAGHVFYSTMLHDRVAVEHDLGLLSHLSWVTVSELIAVYGDYGISPGMQAAINLASTKNKKVEYRTLGKVAGT